ncbi:ArsR/SmtB family transcription factor [Streptomyces sp. NPDC057690]|uniref:ArsR/SmtB family transcription factor n=1 Tax=Streptomyces sp. NPDC057690 TaxID=3346214 RepID=UPI003677F9A9
MSREAVAAPEAFKALGDPIRWSIVQQIAEQDELACSVLEDTLPVSKPTISYHTKILAQAGLIEVRKRGRNYFYALRRDVMRSLVDELWTMAPGPRLVGEAPAARPAAPTESELKPAVGDDTPQQAVLLTW